MQHLRICIYLRLSYQVNKSDYIFEKSKMASCYKWKSSHGHFNSYQSSLGYYKATTSSPQISLIFIKYNILYM